MTTIVRRTPTHAYPACPCGFVGVLSPTRTIEGVQLAERDAQSHDLAHAHGTGFFDPATGWVTAEQAAARLAASTKGTTMTTTTTTTTTPEYDALTDPYGGERPRPDAAPRAHLADIVAALWANGYRPTATLLAPVWGKKTVYLWVNPATDARWELYTTEVGTAQERIITATKCDAAGDIVFRAGDTPETHLTVLRKINDHRTV